MQLIDKFQTQSFNTADVYKYLKEYFSMDMQNKESLSANDIFTVISSIHMPKSFSSVIIDFLRSTGRFCPQESDKRQYMSFCYEAFIRSGIIRAPMIFDNKKPLTSELLRKNLKNWFDDVIPSRESIFLLAFALKMNCDELSMFLTRILHDKDVNFKYPAEAAAYICLRDGQDYSYAVRLLNEARIASASKSPLQNNVYTEKFKTSLLSLASENQLIEHLAVLIAMKEDPDTSICILECYTELLTDISEYAVIDKNALLISESGLASFPRKKISFGTVERYLYYYTPSRNKNGRLITDTYALYDNGNISDKKNNLLGSQKWFFSTLLRRSDLKKMLEGSRSISRDSIITLAFFKVCEENPDYKTYDYICDINDYLCFCRFEPINFSYPYDLFIFMCLQTDDPLNSFRKIWKMSWIK